MAKGCWRVRIGKKLKVEQAAYRRSRPRWSVTSVLDLVHPMAPQGATRVGGEKSLRHTLPVPFRRLPPLVAGATTFAPIQGHYGCWALRTICAWSSSEGKTIQPGFARGNAPLLVPAAPLPPEGEVCSPLGLCSHKNRDGKHRANLPHRGRCRRQKGCISIGPQARFACFFFARQGGCKGFIKLAPKAPTTTLGPKARQT